MSEALGNSDSPDDLLDGDLDDDLDDDEEFDDLDLDAAGGFGWSVTLTSPEALGIASLVLATVSLIGLLSSYLLVNAVTIAHPETNQQSASIFGVRVTGAVELGLGLLALLFAILAHGAARHDPDEKAHRVARAMAGAALLLALVSIAESGGSLLISLAAHATAATGG
jgi:O-antigen/teichoic acid export membrane protein